MTWTTGEVAAVDLYAVLAEHEAQILDEAVRSLRTAHFSHDENWPQDVTRSRLAELYEHVITSLRNRDLAHIVRHCETMATARFEGGFDLVEVQTAFNTLEQSMWRRVVGAAPTQQVVEWVGLLSTVLGAGKDAVARTYVSLASRRHAPAMDVSALAKGTI